MRKLVITFLILSSFKIGYSHDEIEKTENHLYINSGYTDFYSSKMKKFGYFNIFKYGFLVKKKHNIILDKKTILVKTKLDKNLKVHKYSIGYQYVNNNFRGILNILYVEDNLLKEADNTKSYGLGFGYKQIETKGYITKFKNFDTLELDLKYFLIKKKLKYLFFIKTIKITDKVGISQNANKLYTTFGFFSHYITNKYHLGANLILGKRAFTILDNGANIEHHPLEFKYTFTLKLGKTFNIGTIHLGYSTSEAKELPFNNNIKINKYFLDYSLRF